MEVGQRFIPSGIFTGIFLPNCILKCEELSAIDKLVYACLASHAGEDGVCYPKQSTIAEEIGCSERSVKTSIQNLSNNDFIAVEAPTGTDKLLHLNNKYYFLWHEAFHRHFRTGKSCTSEGAKISPPDKKNILKRDKPPIVPQTFLHVFLTVYQQDPNFIQAWTDYILDRKDRKTPVTERAAIIIANKLRKECKGDIQWATDSVKQSTERGYRGVFVSNKPQPKQDHYHRPEQPSNDRPRRRGPRVGCDPNTGDLF